MMRAIVTTVLAIASLGVLTRAHAREHLPENLPEHLPPSSSLTGRVIDAETREPLGWATVGIVELKRAERSHRDGTFHFVGIPAGRYTLRVSFIGYETVQQVVDLPSNDSIDLVVALKSIALTQQTVVVTAKAERATMPYRPDETITGAALQQRLGRTLAETIAGEAGIAQRSMGPATSRPVVRGLGGDRLQLLEDGVASGDLSATSSDHAVTIDPLNAERIEILHGPESFLYTANALGGVVNLVRNRIASTHPDRAHGIASLQGESVNLGYTAGIASSIPVGPLALQVDGSARRAGDIATPSGTLANTDYRSFTGSLGLSHASSWGFAGAAAGALRSEYGIPGGFAGAHEEGVRVEMQREFAEGAVELLPEETFFRRIELRANGSRYQHREIEQTGDIGTEYGLVSAELLGFGHHDTLGPFARGSFGARYDYRNLVANGVSIPPSNEHALGVVAFEEAPLDRWTIRAAARLDHHVVLPESSRTSTIGAIGDRTFTGVSGSLGVLYNTSPGMQIGLTAMRTFRTPTIDELFSEGPHLASYSYEVGNPELDAETGLGVELSARYADERGHLSIALFRNDIDGYIYPRNTGDTSVRLRLPIYQQTGAHAVMMGFDASAEWEALDRLVVSGTLSFVEGELVDEDRPLPMIPPLGGRIGLRYAWKALTVGASIRGAMRQERVGEHEEPTDGYLVGDLFAQFQHVWGSILHTLALTVENVADTGYRSHLSRTKSIMPEPGRNARLLYRVYF